MAVPTTPTSTSTSTATDRPEVEQAIGDPGLFTAERLALLAAEAGMVFPESVLGAVTAALRSGKHVVLTGPPGTGKTTLAKLVAELGHESMLCTGHLVATATATWTADDTIGGSAETSEGAAFRPGVVTQAIQSGRWLVVDELNRADVDKALGALFSVLSGQEVVLGHRRNSFTPPISLVPPGREAPPDTDPIFIPRPWRMIATMNSADRGLLFDLSRALVRRFAFVHLTSPDDDVYRQLLAGPGAIVADLLPLREVQEIGPAMFVDAADYAGIRLGDGAEPSLVLLEAFNAYFLPQMEDLDDAGRARLLEILGEVLAPGEVASAEALLGELGLLPAAPPDD